MPRYKIPHKRGAAFKVGYGGVAIVFIGTWIAASLAAMFLISRIWKWWTW